MTRPKISPINLDNIDVYGQNNFDIAKSYILPGGFDPRTMGGTGNIPTFNLPNVPKPPQLNSQLGSKMDKVAENDAGAFGQVAQGLAGIAGGLIGGGARRREQRRARAELARQREAYETFEFKDPSANLTNPFEDLTVNQQQAQFAAQQQQQALAGTLGQLQGAAGSSGIGALAQALAQQQATSLQAASASIGQQERANQMARAQGQQALESARARGAQYVQEREFGRTEDLFNIAAARKAAADQARKAATEGLIGGIANVGVGAARIAVGGGLG